jgi:GDP-4-dehydro-6-deoxy-D-mannose reductase
MKRVLITGITGFAGSHLSELLLDKGEYEIYGTARWRSKLDNLSEIASQGRLNNLMEESTDDAKIFQKSVKKDCVNLLQCEIGDAVSVRRTITLTKPEFIFHLAAQSFVLSSWNDPAQTIKTNVIGQVNLLEAVRLEGVNPRIQIAGSSEEYGLVYPNEVPIKETNPLRPLSPYAVSKVAQDRLGFQYCHSYGLEIVTTRGFNHTGPRRGEVFVTSSFCKQVAEIEAGKREPVIMVGNLEAERDFSDVRDMVRAYLLAVEKGKPGEVYNVASGKSRKIGDVLDMILGLTQTEIKVEKDPKRMRPSDVPMLLGDASKFKALTGWKPEIRFEQTIKDLLDYWRGRM